MSETLEPIEINQQKSPDLSVTNLKTIKRDGHVAQFDENKIRIAISKAFIAVEGMNASASNRIHEQIDQITLQILHTFIRRLPEGSTIHIEDIQDQVELALMRNKQYKVARAYVLYREERRKAREQVHPVDPNGLPLIT